MQAKVIKINPNFPNAQAIKEAASMIAGGKLVAFPTETVYGIGANFLDTKAVDRLYEVKHRPKNKPFSVLIADTRALDTLGVILSERARNVIKKFWPGPLTIVAFNDKKEKIGVRMPNSRVALDLIKESRVPIAAPSANISGEKPALSGEDVISSMQDTVDMILDGGAVEIGVESTVLDVSESPFKVLREGAIEKKALLADYHVLLYALVIAAGASWQKAL